MKAKKIVIIQRILPHYRISFFHELASQLVEEGLEFELYYGQHEPGSTPVSITINEPWAIKIRNIYISIFGKKIFIQLVPLSVLKANIILVEQANAALINIFLFMVRSIFRFKLAYWGHGYNHQASNKYSLSERIKRWACRLPDWWFGYTAATKSYLENLGFKGKKITNVNNSIDTTELRNDLGALTSEYLREIKKEYNIKGNNVAIFCGGLYLHKRLNFLLNSAAVVRKNINDFELIIVGDGPDREIIDIFARTRSWIKPVGAVFGRKKAALLAVSDVMLMPGLVGLVSVDCLVAGLPLITTNIDYHSPEVAYIEHGITGYIANNTVEDYSSVVIDLLNDKEKLEKIKQNCVAASSKFSVKSMAKNFVDGLNGCLKTSA